jgi:phosphatidylserine/phosphatidylglycerophosphate/cardiolipin synthase-like enzyme
MNIHGGFMQKSLPVAVIVCAVTCLALAQRRPTAPERHAPAATEDNIAVYFSPKGGCTEAIVDELKAAKKTIDFQAYSFTSTDIAKALADANERGVKVRALLDKKETGSQYSGGTYLFNHYARE